MLSMKTPRAMSHLLLSLLCGLAVVSAESGRQLEEGGAAKASTCLSDVHAVLREMSSLMAEQKVELRLAKTQIETLEARLKAGENAANQMNKGNQELRTQLLELNQSSTEISSSLLQLKRLNGEGRVSFSVAFETTEAKHTGPFNTGTTLVFKQVFCNVGDGYNTDTGFFTAPVRGMYEFSFSLFSEGSSSAATAGIMRRNRQAIVSVYSSQTAHNNNASNGAILLLEVGDVVDMYMPENNRVFDNSNHHSTFRGHLLYHVEEPLTTRC